LVESIKDRARGVVAKRWSERRGSPTDLWFVRKQTISTRERAMTKNVKKEILSHIARLRVLVELADFLLAVFRSYQAGIM
jgi:hypothetical protein